MQCITDYFRCFWCILIFVANLMLTEHNIKAATAQKKGCINRTNFGANVCVWRLVVHLHGSKSARARSIFSHWILRNPQISWILVFDLKIVSRDGAHIDKIQEPNCIAVLNVFRAEYINYYWMWIKVNGFFFSFQSKLIEFDLASYNLK